METGGHVLELLGRRDVDVVWRSEGGPDLTAELLHGVRVGAEEVGQAAEEGGDGLGSGTDEGDGGD